MITFARSWNEKSCLLALPRMGSEIYHLQTDSRVGLDNSASSLWLGIYARFGGSQDGSTRVIIVAPVDQSECVFMPMEVHG